MITDYTCRPVYLRTDRLTHSLNEWMNDMVMRWQCTLAFYGTNVSQFFRICGGTGKIEWVLQLLSCHCWMIWHNISSSAFAIQFSSLSLEHSTRRILIPGCRHTVLVEVGMNERRMVNKSTDFTILPFPNVIPVTPVTPATNTRMPRNVVCQCGWCVWAKTDFLMHENRNFSSSAGSYPGRRMYLDLLSTLR